jgi:hypothetical protein
MTNQQQINNQQQNYTNMKYGNPSPYQYNQNAYQYQSPYSYPGYGYTPYSPYQTNQLSRPQTDYYSGQTNQPPMYNNYQSNYFSNGAMSGGSWAKRRN